MAVNFYNTHNVANLQLPAITTEGLNASEILGDEANWSSDLINNNVVFVSIHVHTGYLGGEPDPTESTLLIDEIIQVMSKNRNNLDDNYRFMQFFAVDMNVEFEDSQTTGAEMTVELHKIVNYVQE